MRGERVGAVGRTAAHQGAVPIARADRHVVQGVVHPHVERPPVQGQRRALHEEPQNQRRARGFSVAVVAVIVVGELHTDGPNRDGAEDQIAVQIPREIVAVDALLLLGGPDRARLQEGAGPACRGAPRAGREGSCIAAVSLAAFRIRAGRRRPRRRGSVELLLVSELPRRRQLRHHVLVGRPQGLDLRLRSHHLDLHGLLAVPVRSLVRLRQHASHHFFLVSLIDELNFFLELSHLFFRLPYVALQGVGEVLLSPDRHGRVERVVRLRRIVAVGPILGSRLVQPR
mmetsp:Transcript_40995/g.123703  ORF Transcript_40995/g.123703 Transcript_40995/m.123703 type:complete len:285 (+) Transcript_40995:8327-9181(+)